MWRNGTYATLILDGRNVVIREEDDGSIAFVNNAPQFIIDAVNNLRNEA